VGQLHAVQNYCLIPLQKIILYFYGMSHSIYNYKINLLQGGELNFADYKGRKILLVNTASECGLTPQYAQLQELHENYGNKVAVIGLPCNDFGGQEPGTVEQITTFCETRFGVTFPLTEKVTILGPNPHPIYRFLTSKELNGYADSEVKWNFQKYLINEEGSLIKVFSPMAEPASEEVLSVIEN